MSGDTSELSGHEIGPAAVLRKMAHVYVGALKAMRVDFVDVLTRPSRSL